jgi:hypothetical protein
MSGAEETFQDMQKELNEIASSIKALNSYELQVMTVMQWLQKQSQYAVRGVFTLALKQFPHAFPSIREVGKILLQLKEQGCLQIQLSYTVDNHRP